MNDSYKNHKNPFSGINASTLDDKSVLEYWCSPFRYDLFSGITEEDIYQEETNIVFMGGRATGKSMFLRYWSYPIQALIAQNEGVKFSEKIKNTQGIGFYFRIDASTLKSFQGYGLPEQHWAALFCHYFELLVGREYFEIIKQLLDEDSLDKNTINFEFIPQIIEYLECPHLKNISDVISEFDKRIKYIHRFRGDVPFNQTPFVPDGRVFTPKSITFGIANLIKQAIPLFREINFILLLDEYENFLDYQQIFINSILKFTEAHIKLRIGMRLEGFRTYEVINTEDYIKEGREYRKVVLEDIIHDNSKFQNYLCDIARKRLEAIPELKDKGFTNIEEILTKRENLENEAVELSKKDPDKVYKYFLNTLKVSKADLDTVRYKQNPLIEMMNFIWLVRGISSEETYKSMTDFLEGKKTKEAKKYENAYVNKYKLSLMFLMCSIFKTRKKYYSFRTFSFLSTGIVGHFIELCRTSFAIAGWGDYEKLFSEGRISKEDQDTAAIEVSTIAKRQIHRIEDYGGQLSVFVENIGAIFRDYHLDFQIRYPETNQFSINIDAIRDKNTENAMRSAIKWSIIMQKPSMQRSAPGGSLSDLYTLNRIFSPILQISYRTRGGWSLKLNDVEATELMSKKLDNYSAYTPKKPSQTKGFTALAPSLFSDDE